MIGLDTNVLVRYIAQDDVVQSALAVRLIEKQCSPDQPGFVGLITLVELIWVSESCYGATKKNIVDIVRKLLSTKHLLVQDAETVWKALLMFEAGQADFADYLVERVASAAGCTSIVTFDKKAAKAGMTLLR